VQHTIDQYWSSLYENGRDYRLATSQEISKFISFIGPDAPKRALDIGCGTGQLTRELYHRGYQTAGVDASATAIQVARSLSVTPPDQLDYLHFDIESDKMSELPHAPYGLITCKLVYAFIKDKPAFLERVKRLLAPGGAFVVATPLSDDVPPEKMAIAADVGDVKLLSAAFDEMTRYNEHGLTYFVGRK
jgi:SAM-dependent methyltransferase